VEQWNSGTVKGFINLKRRYN